MMIYEYMKMMVDDCIEREKKTWVVSLKEEKSNFTPKINIAVIDGSDSMKQFDDIIFYTYMISIESVINEEGDAFKATQTMLSIHFKETGKIIHKVVGFNEKPDEVNMEWLIKKLLLDAEGEK